MKKNTKIKIKESVTGRQLDDIGIALDIQGAEGKVVDVFRDGFISVNIEYEDERFEFDVKEWMVEEIIE